MTATRDDNDPEPVWARNDAFPEAPEGWGWVDASGRKHPCKSLEALSDAIRHDRESAVSMVWTPENAHCVLPEEIRELGDALRAARARWSADDLDDARHKLKWFGAILGAFGLFAFYNGFAYAAQLAAQTGVEIPLLHRVIFGFRALISSGNVGLSLLMFVIFAFIPWYQARKRSRRLGTWNEAGLAASVPVLRFETWLAWQKAPVTRALLILMAAVGLIQLFSQVRMHGWASLLSIFQNWGGIPEAGLMKDRYAAGEWWRLFTAPLLHGNGVHFLMNAAALAYLGKRLEVFARWPHLPLAFLFSACIGGAASAAFIPTPSVGASGGLMGWLGFLLVFETLHRELVPRRARRRLAAGVLLTALIGVVGYRYIDNAAHAGGLVAGMAYAAIVFPKSSSGRRPRSTKTDQVAGSIALAVLAASAGFAIMRIVAGG